MNDIFQLPIGDFFGQAKRDLSELLSSASHQPPTPPTPPASPSDANSPHPAEFGFYVSFRFDQSLQKTIGPDTWGLYLSESGIASLSNYLVSQGCNTTTAWDLAHDFIYRTLEIEYLADCTLTKFDHLAWLIGGNPAISSQLWKFLPDLREIGMSRAYEFIRKSTGSHSHESVAIKFMWPYPKNWKKEFAQFFISTCGNNLNGHVLWSNPAFSIEELTTTIKSLMVTSAPKKSPAGTALPVHYIP